MFMYLFSAFPISPRLMSYYLTNTDEIIQSLLLGLLPLTKKLLTRVQAAIDPTG